MKLKASGLGSLGSLGLASLVVLGAGYAALTGSDSGMDLASSSGSQRIVRDGVSIELTIGGSGAEGSAVEGSDTDLTLSLTDANTGEPIPGLTIAAWVDRDTRAGETEIVECRARIESYLQADLKTRPVLDLNSYVVLTLNEGPTISVIDPFLGFGTTNLYTRVGLPAPGEDWVLDAPQTWLFVTLPTLNQVAAVSTGAWRVEHTLDVGVAPHDIEMQPNGRGIWVLDGGASGDDDGVTVIDPVSMTVRGRVSTGAGSHRLAFSRDGLVAYVANREAGTVSVIDVQTLGTLGTVETGPSPTGIAYSAAARAAYVVDEVDGSVTAIDRATHARRMRVVTNPGVSVIAFEPMMGHWGFVLNTRESIAHVIDGMRDEIVHTFPTSEAPHQVSFTHNFAYIRSLRSADITMVPLATVREGLFDQRIWPFPAGALPPAAFDQPGPAAAVVPSPEMHDAVYVANPGEQRVYVYHYMEGMPTPSGSLDNYGEKPRAVLTAGRALHEVADGVYRTTIKTPPEGEYDFVFLLEDPRVIHCFDLDVAADPDKAAEDRPLEIELRTSDRSALVAGTPATITFEMVDRNSGERVAEVADVYVLLASPGGWQQRLQAEPRPDGSYAIEVTVPTTRVLNLAVAAPSVGLSFDQQRPLTLMVEPAR